MTGPWLRLEAARADAALARALEDIRLARRSGLDRPTASWLVQRAYRIRDAALMSALAARRPGRG